VLRSTTCGIRNPHTTHLRRCLSRHPLGLPTQTPLEANRGRAPETRIHAGLSAWLLCLTLVLLSPALRAQSLVVIVNPANPVQTLNPHQVLEIFAGKFRSFPNGYAALPIDLDVESAERKTFYLAVAHKEPSEMASFWARATFSGRMTPPFQVSSAKMAVDLVASNTSAIAYVDREAVDSRVKVVLELTP
jgi:hypothetical protein